MKKLVLSVAFVALTMGVSNAQNVKFGVKAGLNLATIVGDFTRDDSIRTSFHFGGIAEIVISNKFSVQPELLYSSQGAALSFTEPDFLGGTSRVASDDKLDYLNIPIMAKYYVYEGLSIEAGPQIGVLLSAERERTTTTTSDTGVITTQSATEDIKDDLSTLDLALGLGLGYKLNNGLNFSARSNFGLSNINDFDGSDDFNQQNSVFQLSVGFTF